MHPPNPPRFATWIFINSPSHVNEDEEETASSHPRAVTGTQVQCKPLKFTRELSKNLRQISSQITKHWRN